MEWGTLVIQITAIIGGLAALVAILNGVYELREKRRKSREQQQAGKAANDPLPPGPDAAANAPSTEPLPVTVSSPVSAPGSPPPPLTNLPTQATGLIGRERELAELKELLLRPEVRLVTLTGPAGIGKTRLALQAACDLLDHYSAGAFFVSLAPISDPALVVPTVAQVLDVREQGSKPLLDSLKDYLHDKHLLLVLDNFEQVVLAAEVVAELIAAAPHVSFIITSREVLRLYGEHAFVVPSLTLPDLDQRPAVEIASAFSGYEAVRLFVTRAEAADSSFALNDENAAAIAEIVHRLDGLPLAIELAAARIRILSPQAMLQRLVEATGGSSLELLTGGPRDLPARQRTLRNTIAWSYNLLDEADRRLFQCLGVFSGGWTLEAAEAVCATIAPEGNGGSGIDVLDGLESLIGKSLIWRTAGNNPRFMMLQTIRDYALEQLELAGLARAVRLAHAAWYLRLAEEAEPQLYSGAQMAWLQRLDAEQANLRTALSFTLDDGQSEVALQLAGKLSNFWSLTGRVSEGRSWLEAALVPSGSGHTEARAVALSGLADLVSNQGDWPTAWAALEESVAISRDLGDHRRLARGLATLSLFRVRGAGGTGLDSQPLADESLALARSLGEPWTLGYVLTVNDSRNVLLGNHPSGPGMSEEALRCFEAAGDQWGIMLSLRHIGMGAIARGDYAAARVAAERALAVSRAIGDRLDQAYTLSVLADIARIEGDYERASGYYEEALALYRDLGLKGDIAATLHGLGHVTLARGQTTEARSLQTQSLEMHRAADNKAGMLEAITGLAAVARVSGDPSRAARLLGAVEALRTALDAPLWPAERVEYDRHATALRAELDEAVFEDAWAKGATMTLEQATVEALAPMPLGAR